MHKITDKTRKHFNNVRLSIREAIREASIDDTPEVIEFLNEQLKKFNEFSSSTYSFNFSNVNYSSGTDTIKVNGAEASTVNFNPDYITNYR